MSGWNALGASAAGRVAPHAIAVAASIGIASVDGRTLKSVPLPGGARSSPAFGWQRAQVGSIGERTMLFAMLTRLTPEAVPTPQALWHLERRSMKRIHDECPDVKWVQSYSVLGRHDYLDIFDAPDVESATKVAVLIRSYGHAATEVWPIVEWGRFKSILRSVAPTSEESAPLETGAIEAEQPRADYGFQSRDDDITEHDYGAVGHEATH
jgi:uncharacterized protein with GYD domain